MIKKLIIILLIFTLVAIMIIMITNKFLYKNNNLHDNKIYLNEYTDVLVSKVMTLDEMINSVMKEENTDYSNALKMLGISKEDMTSNSISFRNANYITITSKFDVNKIYKPSMKFRCEISEEDGNVKIKKILNISMDRKYNKLIKQFQGSVFVHLEDSNRIYYSIDGDFYNYGTTNFVNKSLETGDMTNIDFSVSDAHSHFEYIWIEKTIEYEY